MTNYYASEVALTPATKELWKKRPVVVTYPHERELAKIMFNFKRVKHLMVIGKDNGSS